MVLEAGPYDRALRDLKAQFDEGGVKMTPEQFLSNVMNAAFNQYQQIKSIYAGGQAKRWSKVPGAWKVRGGGNSKRGAGSKLKKYGVTGWGGGSEEE
jgi:hypothetical protein